MCRRTIFCLLGGLVWPSVLTLGGEAQMVSLSPTKDNTLYEDSEGLLSNGMGEYLFAGTAGVSLRRRALLHFDIGGNVPAGSVIESVMLRMYMSRSATSFARSTSLHRVLRDWGEGTSDAELEEGQGAPATDNDATWNHAFLDDVLWSNQGGDFAASSSSSVNVAGLGFYTWGANPELNADVQLWLDEPTTNFGWIVIGDETEPGTAKRFNSREYKGDPLRKPVLFVSFMPPAQGACCFSDVECVVLGPELCENKGGRYAGDDTECGGDSDSDTVLDACDNCPNHANQSQTDFDGDGFGNVCDGDIDDDGVPNESDVCDFTPPGTQVQPDGGLRADANGDCAVDLMDYAILQNEITGP